MTDDELALLKTVLSSPEDDTPRLVYADWLDEHAGTAPCPGCGGTGFEQRECKVCGARPDSEGCIDHGRGCYVLDSDGGGSESAEQCPHCADGRVPDSRRERAEFIRVGCWLARWPGSNDSDVAKHMRLSKRAVELLEKYGKVWANRLPDGEHVIE
jgi:uncharacterized protein (TIGR02996 family)